MFFFLGFWFLDETFVIGSQLVFNLTGKKYIIYLNKLLLTLIKNSVTLNDEVRLDEFPIYTKQTKALLDF